MPKPGVRSAVNSLQALQAPELFFDPVRDFLLDGLRVTADPFGEDDADTDLEIRRRLLDEIRIGHPATDQQRYQCNAGERRLREEVAKKRERLADHRLSSAAGTGRTRIPVVRR